MTAEINDRLWHSLGRAAEFVEDEPVLRVVGGKEIAVFRVGEKLFALDDRCSHGDARLSEGWVEDGCVECPLHQARFNLMTGEAETGPAWEPIGAYVVRIDGEEAFVGI